MTGFSTRATRSVARAAFLELVEHDLETPDGEVVTRYVVRHPGAVVVVPLTAEGDVVMVRQYRVPAGRELLELPAGKREPGEEPESTAARELAEEVGLSPGRLTMLAEFWNSPGFCDEVTSVYLGEELRTAGERPADLKAEERHLEIVRLPLEQAVEMVVAGEIADAKTIVGVLLASGGKAAPAR